MYDLPPKRTEKRGRPRKYGGRLSPGDFGLKSPKTEDLKIGVRPVLTRLWGTGWSMPLSRPQKAGGAAAGFSSAPKTRKVSSLITAGVKMKQYAAMGKKTYSSCHLPVIHHAGISKYPTMKAKLSGHWRNTAYGAAGALNA